MDTSKHTDLTSEETKPVRIAVKLDHPPGQRLKELSVSCLGKVGALALYNPIEGLDEKKIDDLISRARKLSPKTELPDLSSWYEVVIPPGVEPKELVAALRELKIVKTAYAMRPVAPPTNPPRNPRNPNQGYQDPAPKGIDARSAWQFKGGDGTGIGFVDMERGWNLNHEDLPPGIIKISGDSRDHRAHGTSVLGIVLMADNQVGGLGIARGASPRVVSQWQPTGFDNYRAILSASSDMPPGDVLLLEAQDFDPDRDDSQWPINLWPVEIAPATYEAITIATAAGVVVVEAAGDGGNNLDQYTNGKGEQIFDPAFRDSGAIIVGAATSALPHTPLGTGTNTGQRVDCYAWGDSIDTTDTDAAGNDNTAYRPDPINQIPGFDGTSGAAAIVAGAALIVQGLAREALGAPFGPQVLRQILKTNGTNSAGGAGDGVGVMPNLAAIIRANRLGLVPAAPAPAAPAPVASAPPAPVPAAPVV